MKLSQALQGLSDSAQIKSSSGFGIYTDSNKPTGFLASLKMGFSAIFRSKADENSFREGYNAALRMVREDASLTPGAAARFEQQFGDRYNSASPLTAGRIKAFLGVEQTLKTEELASSLEGLQQKISEHSGDTFQLIDTLGDLRSLRDEVSSQSPSNRDLVDKIESLAHGIEGSLGLVASDRSSGSLKSTNSGLSDRAAALANMVDKLGPNVSGLQGNADRFAEVLTDIFEASSTAESLTADEQTFKQIDKALDTLLKNFGISNDEGSNAPGLRATDIYAIQDWGSAQAERRISEKNGTPLSPDREKRLQQKEAKAYKAFEAALSRVPSQYQAILKAGAEIRQNIAKGINLSEEDYGFGNNTPQLQQKPAEALEKLLSTRKQGDDYFEFNAS
jgi:hypothetical protein